MFDRSAVSTVKTTSTALLVLMVSSSISTAKYDDTSAESRDMRKLGNKSCSWHTNIVEQFTFIELHVCSIKLSP